MHQGSRSSRLDRAGWRGKSLVGVTTMPIYRGRRGALSYGHDIGVLMIDCFNPFPPGDVGNATTFDFPVLYHPIEGVDIASLINRGDTAQVENVVAAAKHLETQGVAAITSDCGYMLLFQDLVAPRLSVPVMLSSLLQLPFIAATIAPGRAIGIICANASALRPSLLDIAFPNRTRPLVIRGMERSPAFVSAILREEGTLDSDLVEREAVAVAQAIVTEHPEVGAILLECSNLPPYAHAVQQATARPVFDFTTMIGHMRAACRRGRFEGHY